jgi:hypothetical protein
LEPRAPRRLRARELVVRWGVSGRARHMAAAGEVASGRLPGEREEGGVSASWRRVADLGVGEEVIGKEYCGPEHGRAPPNVRH